MGTSTNQIFSNLMSYSKEGVAEEDKKLKPTELMLKKLDGYGFNLNELEGILKTKGNQLAIACAGSGKTTTLTFKIIYDLKSGYATRLTEVNGNTIRVPEKIWVSTFLKSGAEELADSLRQWQMRLNYADTSKMIHYSTLHAEFKRVLNQMSIKTDLIMDSENKKLLKSAISGYSLTNGDGKPLNSDKLSDLMTALSYTRNRLDAKRYEHKIYDDFGIGQVLIDAIIRDWKSARITKGVYDFEDLQEKLYDLCYIHPNQEVIDYIMKRYNFIYIDEFQDTSQIQYALLKVYCANCKQVFVVGDDDQSIYGWRGSCNDIITKEFPNDFSPVINKLTVNYRCPNKILDAIKDSITNNANRYEKALTSYKDGGEVRYGAFPNYRRMVDTLSDMVYEDIKKGRSVAILCRVNSDGLMPALLLDRLNKFSYSISGDGMTLDSYIGRLVMGIVKLFTDRCTPAVKSTLNMLTWDSYCINGLMKVCKANKLSIWTIDPNDLKYSCPDIYNRIMIWRHWRETKTEKDALKLVMQDFRTSVFTKDTRFNDVVKSVIVSVEALIDYLEFDSAEDFLYELEDVNERLKARKKTRSAQVRIATVHEFKGKEADSVYVWNDSKDVFPYRGSEETKEDYEEERRVHYIACTRAKKVSTVMYLVNKAGDFVHEMDLSDATEIGGKDIKGTVKKEIKGTLEEQQGLEKFENKYDIDFGESSDGGKIDFAKALRDKQEAKELVKSGVDSSTLDDNEYWANLEEQAEEYEDRYNNAEDDFQSRMRGN